MKLYAIRDRLIDYFMQPFSGPDDKSVLAAVAKSVNQEGPSDIAQAPHHFEVWSLAQVSDQGHIVEDRYLVATCDSLIRPGIRQGQHGEGPGATQAAGPLPTFPGGAGQSGRANGAALQGPPPTTEGPADEIRRGPQGGYPPRGDS